MHLYFAVAVTMTCISYISADAPAGVNQNAQVNPGIIATAKMEGVVKRSLRFHDKDAAFLNSLDNSEERGGNGKDWKGVTVNNFSKILKSRKKILPVNVATLNNRLRQKVADELSKQGLSQEQFAAKLGMDSVEHSKHHNADFFEKYKHLFQQGQQK